MQEQKLTGYPSVDKPWLKYYKKGAEEAANNIPVGKTVWDVIEEKLYEHIDIPAIKYFGRVISRKEFIGLVYTWARVFKALGVKEDEVVAYYGPFLPDVGAMAYAMNMIGACMYFLKLAISPEALAEETKDCRFAICFEDMWQNVGYEFSKDRFEKVIIINAIDGMGGPKKQVASLIKKLKSNPDNNFKGEKYFSVKEAKKLASTYTDEVKAPFTSNRPVFITSSSGTTVGGIVKGCIATNESIIAQLLMGYASGVQYYPGCTCLNHFPPTASTSLNSLFDLALYMGLTVLMDPRVSEEDFYNQITQLKPNIALTTGSSWEAFYNRIEKELNAGRDIRFDYAMGWTVGGEGTDIKKFNKWNEIMKRCGANGIFSGYGSSEVFSAVSVETVDARYDPTKEILSVGLPYAGTIVGVFSENGQELCYNQRGELWVKSPATMKEYYNKPELTAQTKINGWIHTGDMAEIDENGFIYIWGRVKDTVEDKNGNKLFLFDIANKLKVKKYINDAIVLPVPTNDDNVTLAAHIVWSDKPSDTEQVSRLTELNDLMSGYLPQSFKLAAYSVHDTMLPYSPTTLKKDKNRMSKQTDGYIQVSDGQIKDIAFVPDDNGNFKLIFKN